MQKRIDTKPWYRQFWPWLVIALPASVVVAGVITLNIANRSADDMVVDSYYKDGKAINQRIEQDVRAAELELLAELSFNFDSGQLNVSLTGQELPSQLHLKLLHPVEADLDHTVLLEARGEGAYRGQLTERLHHRYHLRLLPGSVTDESEKEAPWRLNGEINFQLTNGAILSPQP